MFKQDRVGSLVVASCLCACASIPDKARVSLEIATPRKEGPGERSVMPEETLKDGDKLAMKIRVDRPTYVYLVRAPASGASVVLYPDKGDEEARPGQVLRVPTEGNWFELSGERGLENVVLVASARPLTPDAILDAQQHATPVDDKKNDKKKCNPKENQECNRGDERRQWSHVNRQGIAVIRFPFQHQ